MHAKRDNHGQDSQWIGDKIEKILVELSEIRAKLEVGYVDIQRHNDDLSRMHSRINKTIVRMFLAITVLISALSGLIISISK